LYICSSKLPNLTLSFWEQSLHNKTEIPTWLELNAFLTERHRSLEATDDVQPSGSSQSQPKASASSAASRRINSCETRVAYITASHEGISCCKSYIRIAAAITPYYTEVTPPHRLPILLRDPDQDQIHPIWYRSVWLGTAIIDI